MTTESNIVFPPNSTGNPGFRRHEGILTVGDLKSRYLFGVVIKDDFGNELPEHVYQEAIDAATSELEHELDLTVTPTQFTEKRDYDIQDYQNWSFLQLYHYPVISVEKFTIQFIGNETLLSFPAEWFRVYHEKGQIHITPTTGAIGQFNLSNQAFLPQVFGVRQTYPQLFEIKYTAGFEQDKIPMAINRAIGLRASIPLLDIAGDLILGAGIANQSISLDGLSQSIGSTSSATNAGYGARIISYQKQLKELLKTLHNYYKGPNFFVV